MEKRKWKKKEKKKNREKENGTGLRKTKWNRKTKKNQTRKKEVEKDNRTGERKKKRNWKGKDNSRRRKRRGVDSSSRLNRHWARVVSAFALRASYISVKIESAEGAAAGLIYTVSFSFNPTWERGRSWRVTLLRVLKETFKIFKNLLSFPSLTVTRLYRNQAIKNTFSYCHDLYIMMSSTIVLDLFEGTQSDGPLPIGRLKPWQLRFSRALIKWHFYRHKSRGIIECWRQFEASSYFHIPMRFVPNYAQIRHK